MNKSYLCKQLLAPGQIQANFRPFNVALLISFHFLSKYWPACRTWWRHEGSPKGHERHKGRRLAHRKGRHLQVNAARNPFALSLYLWRCLGATVTVVAAAAVVAATRQTKRSRTTDLMRQ